ncbi:reverse transcriptase domain-containing protein [Endozoicomonas gorgoniicola]|uniref:Reverse transcriptase domain-containing protein n=1 Tax=Endozoicomonas gorgoniicola TaxID=1234144 RepID=A0ABT3MUA2_9GAMM|nr:reverse transcriptase domain-containing protein [Endozoicomonas gorgoniicola]MCW7552948.1 reverse transcriptase domain-containing protein [Endozoicomonas gorgoniicola]
MIRKVIQELETEDFRFSPVRVQEIPKKSGKFRRLGIAPPPEKVIQEAMRMILEAIHEPIFSNSSHGFRPARGCHSALKQVYDQWKGVKWIIEGDIKGFFDNVDHHVLIAILRKRIKDERFIKLVWKALRAGKLVVQTDQKGKPKSRGGRYLGTYFQTKIGTPQGAIVSPVLGNIYLHEFDCKVEEWIANTKKLKTANKVTHEYELINSRARQLSDRVDRLVGLGKLERGSQEHKAMVSKVRAMREQQRKTKYYDDAYRAIKYVRYADDWLLGIYGPKEMAKDIKKQAEEFLRHELKLELSPEKTLITRPDREKIMFLGTFIKTDPCGHIIKRKSGPAKRKTLARSGAGTIRLEAPIMDLMDKLVEDGFAQKGSYVGKARRELISRQEWEIVAYYNSVLRGILNYYSFVANRPRMSWIVLILQSSLIDTLASRRRCSFRQVWRKGNGKITALKPTKNGVQKIHFNGYSHKLSLKVDQNAFNVSEVGLDPEKLYRVRTNKRTRSKLGCHCAICGNPENVEMHHVRHIRKMGQIPNGFTRVMAQINRKQIPVCHDCHRQIHNGKYDGIKLSEMADQELAMW